MNYIVINEVNELNKIKEPTTDILQELKQQIQYKKQTEKEEQLKNGIYKWILIYTMFYLLWAFINLVVGLQNNRLMTSKVDNVRITLKDYFVIIGYFQIPLYLFTIFDVLYFNVPAYKRISKICDLDIIMMSVERMLFTMIHTCIIGLVYVAIFISSKLSFSNHECISFIIINIVQLLISIMSILFIGNITQIKTLHNVIKEVNLYDTIPSDEELYEEFYKQYS